MTLLLPSRSAHWVREDRLLKFAFVIRIDCENFGRAMLGLGNNEARFDHLILQFPILG